VGQSNIDNLSGGACRKKYSNLRGVRNYGMGVRLQRGTNHWNRTQTLIRQIRVVYMNNRYDDDIDNFSCDPSAEIFSTDLSDTAVKKHDRLHKILPR